MELYRHETGCAFLVVHQAIQPESWEDYVIYRGLYGKKRVYCLPRDRFTESGKYTRIHEYDLRPDELIALQEITT